MAGPYRGVRSRGLPLSTLPMLGEELGAKYEAINQPSLSLEGHYYELCFLPK